MGRTIAYQARKASSEELTRIGSMLQDVKDLLLDELKRETWFIAGGFASYVLGYTRAFGDVDIYVPGENISVRKLRVRSSSTVPLYSLRSQPVDLIGTGPQRCSYIEQEIARILRSFDLAICRCAIYWHKEDLYVLDFTAYWPDACNSPERLQKYQNRRTNKSFVYSNSVELRLVQYLQETKPEKFSLNMMYSN